MARTTRRTRKQDKEFVVIGLGRFGSRLARRLSQLNHTVLGIDVDPVKVQYIADEISDALILDATNEEALVEIDIGSFETVVVTLIDDFEASTLITISLKQMGVPQVLAVTHSDRHREILLRLGADRVVQPIQESGDRLAEELVATGVMQNMILTPNRQFAEMAIPESMVGKLVASCASQQVMVMAIIRDGAVIANPPGHTVFQEGDLLVVLGDAQQVDTFALQS
ncbi:MAG: TrkA family potassium uptake protein [Chloroflexota bacterium]